MASHNLIEIDSNQRINKWRAKQVDLEKRKKKFLEAKLTKLIP